MTRECILRLVEKPPREEHPPGEKLRIYLGGLVFVIASHKYGVVVLFRRKRPHDDEAKVTALSAIVSGSNRTANSEGSKGRKGSRHSSQESNETGGLVML